MEGSDVGHNLQINLCNLLFLVFLCIFCYFRAFISLFLGAFFKNFLGQIWFMLWLGIN